MAAKANSIDDVRETFQGELAEIGLRLVSVEDIEELSSTEDVKRYDDHLASNVSTWESGRNTVWGSLQTYIANGEA